MTPPESDAGAGRGWAVAGAALVLYLLLAQSTLWGDGAWILLRIRAGDALGLRTHFLYAPLVALLARAGAPLGLSLHDAAVATSAFGAAAGVLFAQRAAALVTRDRRQALAVALLVAVTPGVLFFATVVELHGLFLGLASLALWRTARVLREPTRRGAALLGAATALATLAHASGHLLPLACLLLLAALAPEHGPRRGAGLGGRRLGLLAAWTLSVHALATVGVSALLRGLGLGRVTPLQLPRRLASAAAQFDRGLDWVLPALEAEYLLPLFPLSLVALAGVLRPATRRLGLAYLALLAPYLALGYAVGGEQGAYLLPLAWPAALLAVRLLGPRALATAALVACALGVGGVLAHDEPQRGRAFARGVQELAGDRRAVLLVASTDDLEACFVHLPGVETVYLPHVARYLARAGGDALDELDARLEAELDRGAFVAVTADFHALLAEPEYLRLAPAAPLVADHLERTFRLEPVEAEGFAGLHLTR